MTVRISKQEILMVKGDLAFGNARLRLYRKTKCLDKAIQDFDKLPTIHTHTQEEKEDTELVIYGTSVLNLSDSSQP